MCITNGIPLPPGDIGHIDRQECVGNLNDGAAERARLIDGRFAN